MEIVLKLLKEHQLFAKISKFGLPEIEYLGHVVSGNRVAMDKHKVHAMLEWLVPNSVKQLRALLGLTGYYRRFIR